MSAAVRGPAGLYVHVPFCSAVCPYCDFAVHTGTPEARERFTANLLNEIDLVAPSIEADAWPAFDTVYFGGGTPSALNPGQLERILEHLRSRFPIGPDLWISLEANPEDVDPTSAANWKSLGVRTLSLGIQSLDDNALRFLGRRHRSDDSSRCIDTAKAASFEVVSADLIFGLPSQRPDEWRDTTRSIAQSGVDHVSCYQLTVHEGTPFARMKERGDLHEMPDDPQRTLFEIVHTELAQRGLPAYEVSNFARSPAHRSRHNQKYWHHVPYLGLGPSAHSFFDRRRWWNHRNTREWSKSIEEGRPPVDASEVLTAKDLALESVFLGFRTTDGVDFDRIRQQTGLDLLAANETVLRNFERRGWIHHERPVARPTIAGMAVADALARAIEIPFDDPDGQTPRRRNR